MRPVHTAAGNKESFLAALAAGADHVVVGRPITKADDPLGVIEAMQKEMV